MLGKRNYVNCAKKRQIRTALISTIKANTVYGLAGPTPELFYSEVANFNNVISYELNKKTYIKQLTTGLPIDFKYGDILNAPIRKGAFYDLDFCGNIFSFGEHLRKFGNCNFMLTVTTRDNSGKKTGDLLDFFSYCLNFERFEVKPIPLGYHLIGDERFFLAYKYRDGQPMITIKNIN